MAVCKRCGSCCKNGGPALHEEDRELMELGVFDINDCVTLRRGEWAVDPRSGRPEPLEEEVIKIRGKVGWECRFHTTDASSCRIYTGRPLECRLMDCEDDSVILNRFHEGRLTRYTLLGEDHPLLDLIAEHEARCGWEEIVQALKAISAGEDNDGKREQAVLVAARFDDAIREATSKRLGENGTELLPFLFGRPLRQALRLFGFMIDDLAPVPAVKRIALFDFDRWSA